MVESAYRIEDVSVKKGDIVVNKDKTNNGNGKEKFKSLFGLVHISPLGNQKEKHAENKSKLKNAHA